MHPYRTFLLFSLATCFLIFPGSARAVEKYGLEFFYLLDATIPMNVPFGDKNRVETAAQGLIAQVDKLPPGMGIGLGAFGINKDADCDDIQVIALPGTDKREKIKASLGNIRSGGSASLARAIEVVCQTFNRQEPMNRVVFIGHESDLCQRDASAVAQIMMDLGMGFRLDVIAISPEKESGEKLTALARAGRGNYRQVETPEALFKALDELRELALKAAVPPPDPAIEPEPYGRLMIELPGPTLAGIAGIRLLNAQGDTVEFITKPRETSVFALPAGEYHLGLIFRVSETPPLRYVDAGSFTLPDSEPFTLGTVPVKIEAPAEVTCTLLDGQGAVRGVFPKSAIHNTIPWLPGKIQVKFTSADGAEVVRTAELKAGEKSTTVLSFHE